MNTSNLTLSCKLCNKPHTYKNIGKYNRALNGSGMCNGCSRKGQKRTDEQKLLISEKTKQAMNNEVIINKIKSSLAKPDVKNRMSENTRRQMELLKSDPVKYQNFVDNQKNKRIKWWSLADENKKIKIITGLKRNMDLFWKNETNRKIWSVNYSGVKNPFYGKHHTPETKDRLRKITVEYLLNFWSSDRAFRGFNTKPELKFQKILTENNITFITPYVLNYKLYDIYIPKINTIVEIDGCYWHSKGVLPSEMNENQLKMWKNDRFKDDLAKSNGISLIRIWEDEIDSFNIESLK